MEKKEPVNLQTLRTRHNLDLIRRMRDGSWYPPRPVIEKDSSAVLKLYGTKQRKSRAPKVATDRANSQAVVIDFSRDVDGQPTVMDESHPEAS
jgi:hypothetical protein